MVFVDVIYKIELHFISGVLICMIHHLVIDFNGVSFVLIAAEIQGIGLISKLILEGHGAIFLNNKWAIGEKYGLFRTHHRGLIKNSGFYLRLTSCVNQQV
jgi:hypothetical protein